MDVWLCPRRQRTRTRLYLFEFDPHKDELHLEGWGTEDRRADYVQTFVQCRELDENCDFNREAGR